MQTAEGRRRPWSGLAALALCAVLGASLVVSPALAQAVQFTDDRGLQITLRAAPQRIASLVPSLTEAVCALDACARLVGTDRWSNWPPQVTALPKLGGLEDVQIEALVRLKPDVVLASRSHRMLDRLAALGLTTVALDGQNHGDVQRHLLLLGQLLGDPTQGTMAWARIQDQMAQARTRVPAAWRGRSAYVEISTTPHAASQSSFIGETLRQLGLHSIAPAALGPFPQLSPEFVLKAQPDVIVSVQRERSAMPKRPGWATLQAIAHQQHCSYEPPQWDVLMRPGPRLGEAALLLADCLAALPAPKP